MASAESVSRALGVPVLLHARSKPGCAADIIDFFNGKTVVHSISGLGKRSWSSPYSEQTEKIEVELDDGTMEAAESGRTLLGRQATLPPTIQHTQNGNPVATALPLTIPILPPPVQFRRALDHPKIIAVGDRLSTDVLLARRLALHLRPTHLHASEDTPQPITPPVLSIVTTSLFKKSDVRVLRWMEESWLRLGLAMSRHRAPDSEADTIQILARNWVLARSLDAPQQVSEQKGFLGMKKSTPVVPPAPKLPFRTRISNLRATMKSWVSLDAWKLWFLALIPTRSRMWDVCKSLLMRAGRGMVQGGRRLLPTR
ncbi:hypothetical protein QFC21_002195 [Naganishia friedmannii]|uniref:Uncharacterized protein n=1 Tax=Naganishia friedmannii TaxID=89922 RepID=A0ACC2VWA6_9TREE|nr:hypothetical protein QFC21_002195 [Naganishia friedmannii]